MAELLWKPSGESIAKTNMTAFTKWLSHRTGVQFADYHSLHQWSVDNAEQFWESYLEYTGILHSEPHQQVLSTHAMPGAHWFSGMHLNFTQNILGRGFKGTAIIYHIEKHADESDTYSYRREYNYNELKILISKCARGLIEAGIKKGDRVAGYVANVPEAIIACLACASIGATWSSASPDFGLDALCDRLEQVEPKLVFASTHYRYNGKTFRTDQVVKELHKKISSIQTIVSIPYAVDEANMLGDVTWQDFLGAEGPPELIFTQVPFEHPLYVLFSSGTTGAPKCIIHGTGGPLLQHRKELQLHCDLREGDSLLFFTTCGWMMWNWQLSALSLGTTICLYDGNPAYPDVASIWRVVDELNVTHFGTSGRYLESCMKSQPSLKPGSLGKMSSLRSVLYTGSPLSPNGFHWVYDTIKEDLHLAGISGGTDIVSCFILGNPNLPVIAGEIQCKGLGADVEAFDEEGEPTSDRPGELVCRQPLPSMPIGFLNDPDGNKYYHAYFDYYPGMWRHGDYVQFMPGGGVVVYGRSDATLNPGGVRIGSSEIYSALDHIDFLSGSVVVGWRPPNQSDENIILLVVVSNNRQLDDDKSKMIRQSIRERCSPRHVPHHIYQISEVPVTRSGKTVELSVKAILAGKSISNRNAVVNPQVLEEIEQIRTQLVSEYKSE
jgi:acetoacetyl-CoA synthetase